MCVLIPEETHYSCGCVEVIRKPAECTEAKGCKITPYHRPNEHDCAAGPNPCRSTYVEGGTPYTRVEHSPCPKHSKN